MAGCSAPRAFAVLLTFPLICSAVLGIGVQIQPDTIADRNPISISVSNLTDGYDLNVTLTATFIPAANTSWLNLTNWMYPFALNEGGVTLSGQNVNQLTLLVRAGTILRTGRETGTGNITVGIPMDIPPVMYHDFRIWYEVHTPGAPIALTLVQEGTKSGPEDAVITPSILGIEEGNLTVKVLANGTLQASKGILITEAAPSPTPTEGNATVSPSQTPTSSPTTIPAPTRTTPLPPPPTSPPATPTPVPPATPGGPSPWVLGYVTLIIIVALIADYLLLKD